jgi:hypothetical protein
VKYLKNCKLNDLQWWGYLHVEGSLQVKRYFGPEDVKEAMESPFVALVYGPFIADGIEQALQILSEHLG